VPKFATLSDVLAGGKEQIVADVRALIDQHVSATSGVSGLALKAALKTVTTVAPDYYESRIEKLAPALLTQLQPFWSDFQSGGGTSFGEYLASRGSDVANAVLSVTDERARVSNRTVITSVYNTVRGHAAEHIETALPAVGALVERYAA
jgi:hypothetical protein